MLKKRRELEKDAREDFAVLTGNREGLVAGVPGGARRFAGEVRASDACRATGFDGISDREQLAP